MITYESKFTTIEFLQDKSLQIQTWKHSKGLTEELYKQEVANNAQKAVGSGAKYLISNAQNFEFIVVPELQDWTIKYFFDVLINGGCEKYAVIVGNDLFTKVSIDQTLEESKHKDLFIQYFDNVKNAKEWMLNEQKNLV